MEDVDYQYANMMYPQQTDSNNMVQFQLDASKELEDFRANLLGLEWNDDAQDFVPSDKKEQMINDKGCNVVMSFITPRTSKIFSLSNTNDADIDRRNQQNIEELLISLVRHKDEFNIKSWSILSNIVLMADDIMHSTALKSVSGWEGDGIRKQQSFVEQKQVIRDERKPSGIFPLNLLPTRRN